MNWSWKICLKLGSWSSSLLLLDTLALLADERLVDVRNDTTSGNGSLQKSQQLKYSALECQWEWPYLNESVQLLVTTDGKLQVTRGDTLHLQILRGVTGQLENLNGRSSCENNHRHHVAWKPYLSSEVLQDSCAVDCSGGPDTTMGGSTVLQVTVNTSNRELEAGTSRTWHGFGFCLSRILTGFASCHCYVGGGFDEVLNLQWRRSVNQNILAPRLCQDPSKAKK